MNQTRVSKYQDYRSSLIREGTESFKVETKHPSRYTNTDSVTSTLPIEQVMEQIKEENSEVTFYKRKIKKKYLTISIIVCVAIIAVSIILIIAILLWRK